MNGRNWGALASGALLVAWGAFALVGLWLFRPALAYVLPGLDEVSLESLLCLILSGASLWAGAGNSPRGIRLQSLFGALVVLVTALAASRFIPLLFSGKIDLFSLPKQAEWHMAPLSVVAYMASGIILALGHRVHGRWSRLALQLSILVVLVIAFVSTTGHALNRFAGIDVFDFGIKDFSLSWPTSLGLLILGAGIIFTSSRTTWWRSYYADRPDRQVLTTGITLILVIALISGFVGVSLFANHSATLLKETLSSSLRANSHMMLRAVKEAVSEAGDIIGMSNLTTLLANGNVGSNGTKIQAELRRIKAAVNDSDLVAIRISGNDGRKIAALGQLTPSGENRVQLHLQERAWLFWQDGYRVEVRVPIQDGAKHLGEAAIEFSLADLHTHLDFTKGLGSSGEVVVCVPRGQMMECYPSRLAKGIYRVPRQIDNEPLPMSFAFAGRQGTVITRDYRRQKVLASHTPIPELDIGMVQKIDTEELYFAMRQKLWLSMVLFGLFALAGAAVLYFKVRPAVLKLNDTGMRLRDAQRIARMGSWEWIPATGAFSCSEQVAAIFGRNPGHEKFTMDTFFDAIHPDDRSRVQGIMASALPDGQSFDVEYRIVPASGNERHIHTQVQAFRGDGVAPKRLSGTVQDITERKLQENALRATYLELDDLYNNAPCGYHSLDKDGVILRVNDTELAWLGYRREELLGKHFIDLVLPQSREVFTENFPVFKKRGYIHDLEYDLRRKDGTTLSVLLSASAHYDAAGEYLSSRSTLYDITSLKQAESVLHKQRAMLNAFLSASPVGMLMLDRDLRHTHVNQALAEISGVSVEAHLGRTVQEVVPKVAPLVVPLYQHVLDSGESLLNVETSGEVPRHPGIQRSWLTSFFPILGKDGKPFALGGVILDITERKQMEERLRDRDAALTQAQQIGHMGSWEWDLVSGTLTWSEELYRIFGLDPQHFQASQELFLQIVPGNEHPALQRAIDDALQGRKPYDVEHHIIHSDGTLRLIHGKAQVLRDENGQPLRMTGVGQDITERHDNLNKLGHLNRLYSVLSKANEMFVRVRDRAELFREVCRIPIEEGGFRMAWIGLLDPDTQRIVPVMHWGHEDGYLEAISVLAVSDDERGRGPTGVAFREGISVICSDIETDERMRPWCAQALKRGYRSSAAFPIRENGLIIGAYTIYAEEPNFFVEDVAKLVEDLSADISYAVDALAHARYKAEAEAQLKLLNEALEHRVKMRTRQLEAANKELEAFSYSVSHDLRAPLRSVDGFSQILMRDHADKLDDTGRDYLKRVVRASKRMGELIDDLLQLSRVSRSELKKDTIDMSKLVCAVGREIKAADPERQVEWAIQPDVTVEADGRLMRAMLENLLRNAWKFSAKKPEARIEFGTLEQDGEKVLFVRDNGAGFDMQYAHKLFGAFQRLHRAEEFEGTGIGLATVQRIINHHGGRIWAEGAVGQGATFYFTI
ncbi:MAG: PAS domain S-box protein [Sulfuricella sp.]|nr:PAS domain S-box protein [Sulfuricella sp.]